MTVKVSKVLNHLTRGVEDAGCYTSEDFKVFTREFKSMVLEQLKSIGGTNYKQTNGHYYISGFFTVGSQPYYISLSDVRYSNEKSILIRKCKDYKDYRGETNHFIDIDNGMFNNIARV